MCNLREYFQSCLSVFSVGGVPTWQVTQDGLFKTYSLGDPPLPNGKRAVGLQLRGLLVTLLICSDYRLLLPALCRTLTTRTHTHTHNICVELQMRMTVCFESAHICSTRRAPMRVFFWLFILFPVFFITVTVFLYTTRAWENRPTVL